MDDAMSMYRCVLTAMLYGNVISALNILQRQDEGCDGRVQVITGMVEIVDHAGPQQSREDDFRHPGRVRLGLCECRFLSLIKETLYHALKPREALVHLCCKLRVLAGQLHGKGDEDASPGKCMGVGKVKVAVVFQELLQPFQGVPDLIQPRQVSFAPDLPGSREGGGKELLLRLKMVVETALRCPGSGDDLRGGGACIPFEGKKLQGFVDDSIFQCHRFVLCLTGKTDRPVSLFLTLPFHLLCVKEKMIYYQAPEETEACPGPLLHASPSCFYKDPPWRGDAFPIVDSYLNIIFGRFVYIYGGRDAAGLIRCSKH